MACEPHLSRLVIFIMLARSTLNEEGARDRDCPFVGHPANADIYCC